MSGFVRPRCKKHPILRPLWVAENFALDGCFASDAASRYSVIAPICLNLNLWRPRWLPSGAQPPGVIVAKAVLSEKTKVEGYFLTTDLNILQLPT